MTRKKIVPPIEEITVLKKPREVLKKEIEDRIRLGKALYDRQVATMPDLEQLQKDFASWDDFNQELLRRAFNKIQNEYYTDYFNSTRWIDIDDVIYRIDTSSREY